MKLYLIRHGQPNIKEYSGFPGPELSSIGKQQAQNICKILKTKNISTIYFSDYIRVIETTEPLILAMPKTQCIKIVELREREKEIESHESLVNRVQYWFENNIQNITKQNTAIFGHCGSINMILFNLDPNLKIMNYPYEDQYKCLTPIGGIWELNFEKNIFLGGELIYRGNISND